MRAMLTLRVVKHAAIYGATRWRQQLQYTCTLILIMAGSLVAADINKGSEVIGSCTEYPPYMVL